MSKGDTHTAFGDSMNYWQFFPTGEEGWDAGLKEVEQAYAGVLAGRGDRRVGHILSLA